MAKYYLAIDLGASSGRHILGTLENGKMELKEIYRFSNGAKKINGKRCWDIEQVFNYVVNGIKECSKLGIIPESVAIDTWGLDYVLLDENDKMLGQAVNYRDQRTKDIYEEIFKYISKEELYKETGIQMAEFNTICQLMAVKRDEPEILEKAKSLLMIPDYLNFLLTGIKKQEYSNGTTTQLMNAKDRHWNMNVISKLSLPTELFGELSMPGGSVGRFLPYIEEMVGFNTKVVLVPTHDTASALMAKATELPNTMCISSGTWSLVGMETEESTCTKESLEYDFTNEGGYEGIIDYLKNSMGLWMIQQVRLENNENLSFAKMCEMAEKENIESLVDANDSRFLGPDSMTEEIKQYCRETNQQVPQTVAELSKVVYASIAHSYNKILKELEQIKNTKIERINIVGGGSQADYLNRLTAEITQKQVIAGPFEATTIGNLMCQMISDKTIKDLDEGRRIVRESFDVKVY